MTTQNTSKILDAVLDTAQDLNHSGLINETQLAEYKTLCKPNIPLYSAQEIRQLRERFHISTATLAAVLNTSSSTVRKWETGQNHPSGPSLKLLSLLDQKGLDVLL